MTFRDLLNQKLPAFGVFQLPNKPEPFTGRLEFNTEEKQYILSGVLNTEVSGFEELLIAMKAPRSMDNISGEVFGLGFVDFINADGRLKRSSSSGLEHYEIYFEEMILQEINRYELPETLSRVYLSSHYISNMWFGNSGFKLNQDFDQFKKWNTRVYEVQEDKELIRNSEFVLNLSNHYYESTRYEKHCMIEEKILEIEYFTPVTFKNVAEIANRLARFLQFSTGRYEPFKFIHYSVDKNFFRHYVNLKEEGDTRDIFSRKGFLVPYDMIEGRFDLCFNEWIKLEENVPFALDKYYSSYLGLISEDQKQARIALVDMCSCLETYYYKFVGTEQTDLKKVIKRLLKEIQSEKLAKFFPPGFHLNTANTPHSFVHPFSIDDDRNKYLLEPHLIRRFATKLKALFECLILKNHFGFEMDDIYRRIANPWPNTLYLDER